LKSCRKSGAGGGGAEEDLGGKEEEEGSKRCRRTIVHGGAVESAWEEGGKATLTQPGSMIISCNNWLLTE